MIKADYIHDYWGKNPIHYSLLKLEGSDSWQYFVNGTKFGEIEKISGTWEQVSGRQSTKEVISGMGQFIDNSQFSTLPKEIIEKWPGLVKVVKALSEKEYLIILTDECEISKFSEAFKDQINDMATDKWQTTYQISNSSMSKCSLIEVN